MEFVEYFNKDYFLLELQSAGVIKNDDENDAHSLTLEKVPNITIGLVLAAKSLKHFENHIILNWIRKGRKVTALIEEQFALYDKLSIYLQNNVCTEDDIHKWKQMLNESKYVFPENESIGWSQIFGYTPDILEKVDPEKISNAYIVQQQKEISDAEDEETEQENVTEIENINDESCKTVPAISGVCFSHNYFLSLLQEVGAVIRNDIESDIPISLAKVPNITIGLVLAAKAINFFTDETILTWIRKGRKVTPLIEKQFLLYEKLADYLMNCIEVKDTDKWKSLVDAKYVFPSSDDDGWTLIFGEIPELCHKIDEVNELFKQLETSQADSYEDNLSCKQLETLKTEIDEENTSGRRIISPDDDDDSNNSDDDPLNKSEGDNMSDNDDDKSNTELSNTMAESEDNDLSDLDDDKSNTKLSNLSERSSSELCENEMSQSEGNDSGDSDDNKSNTELSNLSDKINSSELCENTMVQGEVDDSSDHDDNESKTELSNVSEKISSPKLCESTIAQSEVNDSSDSDDDGLEDLFDAVGAELTAAENNDENLLAEIQSEKERNNQNLEMTMENHINDKNKNKSKKKIHHSSVLEDCLSDNDIYDVDNILDYEYTLDSDTETQENREDESIGKLFFLQKLIEDGVLNKDPGQLENSTLNNVKDLIIGHVLGVFSLGVFRNYVIKNWITASMGTPGTVPFGPLKRFCHYLLCEIPSELEVEWDKSLKQKFEYSQKEGVDRIGYIKTLFGKANRLVKHMDVTKNNFEYISNECREFIDGRCTNFSCTQYHICCKNKLCISYPKSCDIKKTKDRSKALRAAKGETESENQKTKMDSGNLISRVVHITHISMEATEAEIVQLGLPFGKVEKILSLNTKNHKKVYAYLEMSDELSATTMVNTLQSCPVKLRGIQVLVQYSNYKELTGDFNRPCVNVVTLPGIQSTLQSGYPENPISRVVHIHQIPPEATEAEIVQLGLPFGKVVKKLVLDAKRSMIRNKRMTIHAFLEMNDELSAIAMVDKLQSCPVQLHGSQVLVQYSKYKELTNELTKELSNPGVIVQPLTGIKSRLKIPLNQVDKKEQEESMVAQAKREGILKETEGNNFYECSACSTRVSGGHRNLYEHINAKNHQYRLQMGSDHIIKGLCHMYNISGKCPKTKCRWPHRCDVCKGNHPRYKCHRRERIRREKEEESNAKFVNDSDDVEERKNKISRFESERSVSPSKNSDISPVKDEESDSDDDRDKSGNDSDDEERKLKRSRFESERFGSSYKDNKSDSQGIEKSVHDSDGERKSKISKREEPDSDGEAEKAFLCEKGEKAFKIPGLCFAYNTRGRCDNRPCRYPHRCDECGGDHPKCKCTKREQRREKEKGKQDDNKIPGMCDEFNSEGQCKFDTKSKPCRFTHRCDQCGGEHPRSKCSMGKLRRGKEGDGHEEASSDSENEGRKRKRSRFESERVQSSRNENDDASESHGEHEKVFKLHGCCHDYNTKGKCDFDSALKPCKYKHQCDQCGGFHPRYKCSSRIQKRGKEKDDREKSGYDSDNEESKNKKSRFESKHFESSSNYPSNISVKNGMTIYEMQLSKERAGHIIGKAGSRISNIRKKTSATIKISKIPNSKNEQTMTVTGSSEEVQKAVNLINSDGIPGMCSEYNSTGACNRPQVCRKPHRCDECGGDHPKIQCTKGKQRTGREKGSSIGNNIGLMGTTSRSRSPVNRVSRWGRDESPSMQHQPPSLPPPLMQHLVQPPPMQHQRPSVPSPQLQHQPFSVPPPPVQYQLPSVPPPQALAPPRIDTSPLSSLSGVAERVAKLTLNKDTSYIIEQIKRWLEIAGIPPKLETIGKLVLEISEKHEKMKAVKGDHTVDYGHGSPSIPSNRQTVSYDRGQPNWGQSSGRMSPQSSGQMYQSSVNNQPGNLWSQSSGSAEANSSGRMSQQNTGQMYQSSGNNQPGNLWSQSSGSAEANSSGRTSQQNTGQMYQSSGNNQPGNSWFQSSGSAEANSSGMQSQQSSGQMYQSTGNNNPGNTLFQSSGNMGNMSGQNEGNAMMHNYQWNQGTPGPAPGIQNWSQGQGPTAGQMWPQGQSNVMPQSNMQGQGSSQGGGNIGDQWQQRSYR